MASACGEPRPCGEPAEPMRRARQPAGARRELEPTASGATLPPARQRQVLEFIDAEVRAPRLSAERAGDRRGRRACRRRSTVHAHLAALQDKGYLAPRPTKPRAIEVALRARARAPPSTAGRCATSRSSATSPPAPACSRPRTSRRCCPLPADFTRRRRAVHAAGPRRLDDRRRHLRRRLRRRPPAGRRPTTATSSSPASPAKRRR